MTRRREHPGRDAVLVALENVLDSVLMEVVVTQDGHPSSLGRLAHVLDNHGLIDIRHIRPLSKEEA